MAYKITVTNGTYPLTNVCPTIHDAYMCLETLSTGLLHDVPIDLDEIMAILVDMRKGAKLGFSTSRYAIQAVEEAADQ